MGRKWFVNESVTYLIIVFHKLMESYTKETQARVSAKVTSFAPFGLRDSPATFAVVVMY
jgi:hypothetical protein